MRTLSLLALILILTACAPVYFPNQLQTPLLKDKGEALVTASVGAGGYEAQAAYSPVKHLDLLMDVAFLDSEDRSNFQLEGGLGGYTTINNLLQLEILGGGGAGYSRSYTSGTFAEENEGLFSRFYIQPNIFLISKYADVGLATRTSVVSFREYGTGVYVEPALVGRFGLENIKFHIQAGLSLNVNDNSTLDYNPFMVNIGLSYYITKPNK